MINEKEIASKAPKNSIEIIRYIGKVSMEIINIQPDEILNRIEIYNVPLEEGNYIRLRNIKEDILRIR